MSEPRFSSPWLSQLQHERPHFQLNEPLDCDVAVVGAGIAGVSTAYQILKYTTSKVLLVDAGRIAHGATGHNAGQVVSYFEKPLAKLVETYGSEMAIHGQNAVESAWDLLEDIIRDCSLRTPLFGCTGYAGFTTIEQVLIHLQELKIRQEAGLDFKPLLVRIDPTLQKEIPAEFSSLILPVPHSVVLDVLETNDSSFIAAGVSLKGCMNSALFCEELVAWMVDEYEDRLTVAEHMLVDRIVLKEDGAVLFTHGPTVTAGRVVLCTNGFENLTIENEAGSPIDAAFHASVAGVIGYMGGYLDENGQPPLAVSYYRNADSDEPYHYLTRRPYERGGESSVLVCIGGPERFLPDRATYDPSSRFPANIEEDLDLELRRTYRDMPPPATKAFTWHGLMGYTPTGIRRIGFEPLNSVLLYNLGCNGVGILPSIYGGKRIAQLLSGLHLPPSIFDPEMSEMMLRSVSINQKTMRTPML